MVVDHKFNIQGEGACNNWIENLWVVVSSLPSVPPVPAVSAVPVVHTLPAPYARAPRPPPGPPGASSLPPVLPSSSRPRIVLIRTQSPATIPSNTSNIYTSNNPRIILPQRLRLVSPSLVSGMLVYFTFLHCNVYLKLWNYWVLLIGTLTSETKFSHKLSKIHLF